MAEATPTATGFSDATSGHQIFISYSHQPEENAEFVRNLAGRLRVAGFSVWLDEEQLYPTVDFRREITKAANQSEIAIFVLTERWVEREWTQFELELFGNRGEKARRLGLARERIATNELGPYLARLQRVSWYADEQEPDARFWQVYCGVRQIAPGPRSDWPEKGRAVGAGDAARAEPPRAESVRARPSSSAPPPGTHPAEPRPSPRGEGGAAPLAAGRPTDCFRGDDWVFVTTDRDEWFGVGPGQALTPPAPRLASYASAAVGAGDRLLVGMCDPMVARLDHGEWRYQPLPAPALSLCVAPSGEYAGTAAGTVIRVRERETERPLCQMRDPVIALAPFPGGLLALGEQGVFGRVALGGDAHLRWLESGAIGRPVGFFPSSEAGLVGLYSQARVGVIDPATGLVTVLDQVFDDGVRRVVYLGPQRWPYAVVTDLGGVVLVDSTLAHASAVRMPAGASAAGCCSAGGRGLGVIWTRDGRLLRIAAADRPAEPLPGENVALAFAGPTGAVSAIAWDDQQGASLIRALP